MKYPHAEVFTKICFITIVLLQVSKSEFYSSVAELGKLLETEEEISRALEEYIEFEEQRLKKIKRLSEQYTKLHSAASKDAEMFLANPVNNYLLVKHLTADWTEAGRLIGGTDSKAVIENLMTKEFFVPDFEDLAGAALALIRLQDTYLLDAAAIAKGSLTDTISFLELSAGDCFELGRHAFEARHSNHSLLWMQESMKRLEMEDEKSADKIEIMEFMAYSAYDIGNFDLGIETTQNIIKLDPNYPRIYDNMMYYQIRFNEQQTNGPAKSDGDGITYVMKMPDRYWTQEEITHSYEELCRGKSLKTAEETKDLLCYLSTNRNAYLFLQPVKVEVLNLKPRVVILHDVMSDKEARKMIELASPKLERAVVQDTNTGQVKSTTDRISKSTNLYDYDDYQLMTRLNRRIEDITGLNTETGEALHVINYGIGGHYDPHFDFAQAAEKIEMFRQLGNRIATLVFYLSDVPAGGSTVFPTSGVEVRPVKGSAAFWYNMHQNGIVDKYTLHAACPVLTGSKWVANKWLHERGNEFIRPCSLDPSE